MALAREHPGYAAESDDDEENDDEVERQSREETDSTADGNFDICAKVDSLIEEAEARAEEAGGGRTAAPMLASSQIRAHNSSRVHSQPSAEKSKRKAERHHRLDFLFKSGKLEANLLETFVSNPGVRSKRAMELGDSSSVWLDEGRMATEVESLMESGSESEGGSEGEGRGG